MSNEQVLKFWSAARNDAEIQQELSDVRSVSQIVDVASTHGFSFNAEEFDEVAAGMADDTEHELNELELESTVAGLSVGGFTMTRFSYMCCSSEQEHIAQ